MSNARKKAIQSDLVVIECDGKETLSLQQKLVESQQTSLDLDFLEIQAIHENAIANNQFDEISKTYEVLKNELVNQQKTQRISKVRKETEAVKSQLKTKKSKLDKLREMLK